MALVVAVADEELSNVSSVLAFVKATRVVGS
jgi:hypothetical protein